MAKNNMSVAMPQDVQDLILISSKKLGVSRSTLIRTLIVKYLGLLMHNEDETPIAIMIPNRFKGDSEGLKNWLVNKAGAFENAISTN